MGQPGPSSRNIIPETPESPTRLKSSEVAINDNNDIPRVGIEIPLGIGLDDSSEDEDEASTLMMMIMMALLTRNPQLILGLKRILLATQISPCIVVMM